MLLLVFNTHKKQHGQLFQATCTTTWSVQQEIGQVGEQCARFYLLLHIPACVLDSPRTLFLLPSTEKVISSPQVAILRDTSFMCMALFVYELSRHFWPRSEAIFASEENGPEPASQRMFWRELY